MARCGCGYSRTGRLISSCARHKRERAAKKAARTRKASKAGK